VKEIGPNASWILSWTIFTWAQNKKWILHLRIWVSSRILIVLYYSCWKWNRRTFQALLSLVHGRMGMPLTNSTSKQLKLSIVICHARVFEKRLAEERLSLRKRQFWLGIKQCFSPAI